jgi:hypothetical protein
MKKYLELSIINLYAVTSFIFLAVVLYQIHYGIEYDRLSRTFISLYSAMIGFCNLYVLIAQRPTKETKIQPFLYLITRDLEFGFLSTCWIIWFIVMLNRLEFISVLSLILMTHLLYERYKNAIYDTNPLVLFGSHDTIGRLRRQLLYLSSSLFFFGLAIWCW